jgi:very-short-patch-repair endonuclease
MKIYLAGKIEPGDWREGFVDPLLLFLGKEAAENFRLQGSLSSYWPIVERGFWGTLDYVGPFLIDEAYHNDLAKIIGSGDSPQGVFQADIVYGFFDKGSVPNDLCAQLGLAVGLKKTILLAMHKDTELRNPLFAFFSAFADEFLFDAIDPTVALLTLLHRREWLCQSPIEVAFHKAARTEGLFLCCQFPVGPYRLDFADPPTKVAIETDGQDWHASKEQRTHDARRDRYLTEEGWRVLRFTGTEIYRDVQRCVKQVVDIVTSLTGK